MRSVGTGDVLSEVEVMCLTQALTLRFKAHGLSHPKVRHADEMQKKGLGCIFKSL